ncbi:uncharacterized protein LOC62_07G009209 [Vanrija pseudolonga]|uniref:Uncharacterized protein n=1 Tax=Vanrija pseudolonga TaxID=143232 RepID=A0AAF0YF71_9TREE|nr:hypothetical protein LOC62_07G009209 [Vanrija pseudolonga]
MAASYADYVCTDCQRLGFDGSSTATAGSTASVVACSVCGAIDERATYIRNAAHTSHIFGTILEPDGSSEIQFGDPREKRHEAYINKLLDIYLVDPRSRLVERPAGHFIPGVRNLYNRFRTEQARTKGYLRVQTSNAPQQVKYHLVSAIRLVILQSNVALVHSQLAHHRTAIPSLGPPLARGDGTVMAPSLRTILARAQALGSDHPGYLDRLTSLKAASKRVEGLLLHLPTTIDVVLSQVLVLSNHLKLLAGLPVAMRRRLLSVNALNAEATRSGKTADTAGPDDLVLDTECWDYMSGVTWDAVLEMALGLYNAQQVVSLWGNQCSVDVSCALLVWAIQAQQAKPVPQVLAWVSELVHPHRGNESAVSRRRAEMRDMLVAWSTSIPEAGLDTPLVAPPARGTVGNGLSGWGSDKRRSIPETTMAIAAAPVVARHWQRIMEARLRTRSEALPLDEEFTTAARMFATALNRQQNPTGRSRSRSRSVVSSRALSMAPSTRAPSMAPSTRAPSMAPSSRAPSVAPSPRAGSMAPSSVASDSEDEPDHSRKRRRVGGTPGPHFVRINQPPSSPAPLIKTNKGMTRDEMLRRMMGGPSQTRRPKSPTIEALLAVPECSSDEDALGDTDDEESTPWEPGTTETSVQSPASGSREVRSSHQVGTASTRSVAEGFSIGPGGLLMFEPHTSSGQNGQTHPASSTQAPSRRPPALATTATANRTSTTSSPKHVLTPVSVDMPHSPRSTGRSDAVLPSMPSPSLSASSLRDMSRSPSLSAVSIPDDSFGIGHTGMLLREREQYIRFSPNEERRKGRTAPIEVEQAMKEWVRQAKAKGAIPGHITKEYLGALGFQGDPHREDLGPFVQQNKYRWSTTECLLRLGLAPLEFPPHLVVHSLIDLHQQLGRYRLEDQLAPEGKPLNSDELEKELGLLFKYGPEKMSSILATSAEAEEKEQQLLATNVWSFPRGVPEHATGPAKGDDVGPVAGEANTSDGDASDAEDDSAALVPQTRRNYSARINFDAVRKLMFRGDSEENSEGGEEDNQDMAGINDALQKAVGDTVLGAFGADIGRDLDGVDSDEEEGEGGELDV